MPIPEGAELALIPCRRCTREHFLYVDRDTRQVLDYDGARAPVRDGESLPAALFRLFNAPCDPPAAHRRIRDLDRDFMPACTGLASGVSCHNLSL